MNRPKLIVMCGLSGSGKSSTAEELAKKYNAEIVSSDSIREEITGDSMNQTVNEEVFKIFKYVDTVIYQELSEDELKLLTRITDKVEKNLWEAIEREEENRRTNV